MSRSLGIFALVAGVAFASGPTSIFIDQVPEYSSMASCAETPVSTIVRDMVYGCGDGAKTTSYACFCYQSSSAFNSMISKHVSITCSDDSSQVKTALDVFNSYCKLGAGTVPVPVPTSTATTLVSSPSPAPASTTSVPTSTATSTSSTTSPSTSSDTSSATSSSTSSATSPADSSTASPSQKSSSNHAAVAAGVAIPICLIAVGGLSFFLWRRYRDRRQQRPIELANNVDFREMHGDPDIKELPSERAKSPAHELYGSLRYSAHAPNQPPIPVSELPADTTWHKT